MSFYWAPGNLNSDQGSDNGKTQVCLVYKCTRGDLQKLELSSGGQAPCSAGFPAT